MTHEATTKRFRIAARAPRVLACVLAACVGAHVGAGGSARAQVPTIVRVNVDAAGTEADAAAGLTAISGDGRYVAFSTSATNLGAVDTNGFDDVYVRDTWLGTTERVSEPSGGGQGDGPSTYPSISADGRWIVFTSWATNLVPNDANSTNDVFLHDRALNVTTRVNVSATGAEGDSNSFLGTLTPNGRFVTFLSFATNLVPGDTNQNRDVFLVDLVLGSIERVSVGDQGQEGDGSSGGSGSSAFTSADGRFVAFTSTATNFVPGDTNFVDDVFLRDRVAGTTRRISIGVGGVEPDDACEVTALTPDAAYLALASAATNLVAGDTNGTTDGFVVTLATGAIERVTVSATGAQAAGTSWSLATSADGRFVAFLSTSSDLVPNDGNGKRDVFLRDRVGGTTQLVDVSDLGQQTDQDAYGISFAARGTALAFSSAGATLVPFDTNNVADAFLRDLRQGTPYCAGASSACPCANSTPGPGGCVNATNRAATLDVIGTARLQVDTTTLLVADVPPGSSVMFLDGAALPVGGTGTVFGDGVRCLGAPLRFLALRHAVGGSARFGFEGGDPQLSVASAVPSGGDYRRYQAWYRDAGTFCTGATFNLTNAVEVLWLP